MISRNSVVEGSLVKVRLPDGLDFDEELLEGDIPENYEVYDDWIEGEWIEVVNVSGNFIGIRAPEDYRGYWDVNIRDIEEVKQEFSEEYLWE